MTTETKFRGGLALTLLGLIIMQFFYFESIRKFDEYKVITTKQTDSLQTLSDSLRDELFNANVEIGRHEITREYFFEKHPKLQLEYENYLSHETE